VALNYPPDTQASQDRIYNLAVRLRSRGHQVRILCANAIEPGRDLFEQFRQSGDPPEIIETVPPRWFARTRRNRYRDLVTNFWFVISSMLSRRKCGSVDIVIAQSPPLLGGLAGWAVARLSHARFVLNISDLFPEAIVAAGAASRNSRAIRIATGLEEFLYRHADLIAVQTRGIFDDIHKRFPALRLCLSICGSDLASYREPAATHHPNGGDFIVGFAGRHGYAQSLDTVLRAASLLSDRSDIKFHLYGDGPRKPLLIKLRDEMCLSQVTFYDQQPKSRMPEILAGFDVALVPLRLGRLSEGTLPAKMYEAMAAAKPVVLAADGEARRMVQDAEAGLCTPSEDPQSMACAILELYRDRELARRMGLNGRRYARLHFDWDVIAEDLDRELRALMDESPR
jgi:colanic acid biosynthesis glycosyl transferase WcaI